VGGDDVPAPGYHESIPVRVPTRLDWRFVALPNEFEPSSPELPPGYSSTEQRYELFVPEGYPKAKPYPLILCVPPSPGPAGWAEFEGLCRTNGVIFASPFGAGNNIPVAVRCRVVLDVLDDARRRLNIDSDRVYLAGMSGGGRIASRVAFSLPEAFAGVMPICGSYSLREEPWVRLRASERLRVVLLSGETDWLRPETEREYLPMLLAYGFRAKLVCYPGGHAMPPAETLRDAYHWLEEGLEQRRALARRFSASHMDHSPSAAEWSDALVDEALARLQFPESTPYGLLQLAGVTKRWPQSQGAARAKKILEKHEGPEGISWRTTMANERLRFALLQSRAFDAHMLTPPAPGFPASREPLWAMLKTSWRQTLKLAKGTPFAEEAQARLDALEKR